MCGSDQDLACDNSTSLFCGLTSGVSANNGSNVPVNLCRVPGTGALGSLCGSTEDATCTDVCDSVAEDFNVVCVNQDSGSGFFHECGRVGDLGCNPFICSEEETGVRQRCRSPGSSSAGQPCGEPEDGACFGICVAADNGYSECREVGDGTLGSACGADSDAPCDPETLVCDLQTKVCRTPANGTEGELCGQRGDAACNTGLVCRKNETGTWACRPAGDQSLGSVCGHEKDGQCATGLACSAFGEYYRLDRLLTAPDSSMPIVCTWRCRAKR